MGRTIDIFGHTFFAGAIGHIGASSCIYDNRKELVRYAYIELGANNWVIDKKMRTWFDVTMMNGSPVRVYLKDEPVPEEVVGKLEHIYKTESDAQKIATMVEETLEAPDLVAQYEMRQTEFAIKLDTFRSQWIAFHNE